MNEGPSLEGFVEPPIEAHWDRIPIPNENGSAKSLRVKSDVQLQWRASGGSSVRIEQRWMFAQFSRLYQLAKTFHSLRIHQPMRVLTRLFSYCCSFSSVLMLHHE